LGLSAIDASAWPTNGVIIREEISLEYEQNAGALPGQLEDFGDRLVVVRSGESLSDVIGREYGVYGSNAPDAYKAFEEAILDRNDVANANRVTANTTLAIPDAPKNALSKPSATNPLNRFPKIAIDPRIWEGPDQTASDLGKPTAPLSVSAAGRKGASKAVIYRLVTPQEAERLASNGQRSAESAPIEIRFGAADGNGEPNWLDQAAKDVVRAKLAKPAQQHPVLLILDDAWPDDARFRQSRDYFAQSLAQVRKHFNLPDASFSAALANATQAPWAGPAPTATHAASIRDALVPLDALAPAEGRVETIYLPLFTSQRGAAELVHQLIVIDQALLNSSPPYYEPPPSDTMKTAKDVAAAAIKRLDAARANGDVMMSDVAVVQAAMNFCGYFNEATGRPCFFNMSWTVPQLYFKPRMPVTFHGLLVAAAGNEGTTNQSVYALKREFASRSTLPNADVLAVMNIDSLGNPVCKSSYFGTNLVGVFGVAFPGFVTPSVCGTSFSAPRVAWLIAAREAVSPRPEEAWRWRSDVFVELTTRNTFATGYNRARLDPVQLFSKVQ
jgi:hypothetical protein